MKEIEVSFQLRMALKRTDHWLGEDLLRLREEAMLGGVKRVMEEIEAVKAQWKRGYL
jgi:hypothetical protein